MIIYKSFDEIALRTGALTNVDQFICMDNMSTIDRFGAYKINDHTPPHVHIIQGNKKLGKLPIYAIDVRSMTLDIEHVPKGDLTKIEEHIEKNHGYYVEKWQEIQEKV